MPKPTVNTLLTEFSAIAAEPRKQFDRYLAEGKKPVLTAPEYTPNELIHSLGLLPFGAWGADVQLDEAKRYFPAFLCALTQSIVELGMRGSYRGALALVVPYLCDSLKVLGENWKYAVPSIPLIPMPYPQNRRIPAGIAFVNAGYQRVARDLTQLAGVSFSEKALSASIHAYNRHNAVMRRFALAAARTSAVGPAERSAVFKSAYFTTVEEHTAKVEDLLVALEAKDGPPDLPLPGPSRANLPKDALRIVTSGIIADHPQLLDILTVNGFVVVGDDVAAESRQYLIDAPSVKSSLNALALKFSEMGTCSLLYDRDKPRINRIIDVAKSQQAQGVLVVLTKFCDPEEFDIPFITRACRDAGLASLVVEYDRQMGDLSQIRTAVLAFKELLLSKRKVKQ
jgi:benzoyl-CoA reductase/2-hydroxyglutaryl-CoA dehydratase subunit BcrC/BadD/HgdB